MGACLLFMTPERIILKTKLGIIFTIFLYNYFLINLIKVYIIIVKRILRYVKEIINYIFVFFSNLKLITKYINFN